MGTDKNTDLLIKHLSFSRLRSLQHSPKKLAEYLSGDRIETDAMKLGSLLDCLLFEPEKFDERYLVYEKPDRRTKAGKLEMQIIESQAGNRSLVTTEELANARFLDESIRMSSTVAYYGLLNPDLFRFQEKTGFNYGGFYHKGIKDADGTCRYGLRTIWDLKRMGAASGEKEVRFQIRKGIYDLQAAIYCHPFDIENEPVKYYVIAVDNKGYVTPFEITKDARDQARIQWNILIKAAHRVNMEGLDMGPEFWAGHDGFFKF